MWKKLKRIARLLSMKTDKALKKAENKIEIYEHELAKSRIAIEKIGDSRSKISADLMLSKQNLEKEIANKNNIEKVLKRAAIQNDSTLGHEAMGMLRATQTKIDMYETKVRTYEAMSLQLGAQYDDLKELYTEKTIQLEGLKAQNEFATNMRTINQELAGHYSTEGLALPDSFESIEQDLKREIFYESDKNMRLTENTRKNNMVREALTISTFDEYRQELIASGEILIGTETTQKLEAPEQELDAVIIDIDPAHVQKEKL